MYIAMTLAQPVIGRWGKKKSFKHLIKLNENNTMHIKWTEVLQLGRKEILDKVIGLWSNQNALCC